MRSIDIRLVSIEKRLFSVILARKSHYKYIVSVLFFDIETKPHESTIFSEALLSPVTAQIATVTVYDIEQEIGTVYINNPATLSEVRGNWQIKQLSESKILIDFWEGLEYYDTFVGFGTRSFDVPFITHRSISHGVRPSGRLRNRRIVTQQSLPFHVDLLDQFSFDGASRRVLSLTDLGGMYGLTAAEHILKAEHCLKYLLANDTEAVFTHCTHKALATADLYDIWLKNLAPPYFINATELL